ncbi:MAG TPA: serine hydrolase [Saprospiraceae bacterium]|nr:serine hydrolase [Saprospiraceae bacterium]
MARIFLLLLGTAILFACERDAGEPDSADTGEAMYFPPKSGSTWATLSPEDLGWSGMDIDELYTFLEENNTRAFLLLKDGKIVLENYWGTTLLGNADFDRDSPWYWASAGKTLTAFLVGKAQEGNYLNISEASQNYLGAGWSSLSPEQETAITIRHHLTMTTGLDYRVSDLNCTDPECLSYRAAPGSQWYYHNAPYTLLERVVEQATNEDYNNYTDQELQSTIGMEGTWLQNGYNNVYYSTARDAARFGLLMLNEGSWDGQTIMEDQTYLQAMITPSQELNPAYGYLWWLNGQEKAIYPGLPTAFLGAMAPQAPADLFAGLGKNGQFVGIVPSQNIVVIRMGMAPDDALVPIQFHNEMWRLISGL